MPPKGKKSQTRLTFEPVAPGSSPHSGSYSPAKVRFTGAASSSPSRSSPMAPPSSKRSARSSRRTKPTQSRLDLSSGPPPASFMPRIHGSTQRSAGSDSSDESAAEIGDAGHDEEDVDDLPPMQEALKSRTQSGSDDKVFTKPAATKENGKLPRSSQSVSTRLQRTIIDDDDDDEEDDDVGPIAPSSSLKRRRPIVIDLDDSDDDAPLAPPSSAMRRSRPAIVVLDDSNSSDDSDARAASPAKRRKISHQPSSTPDRLSQNRNPKSTPGRLRRPQPSSPTKKSAHKGHRSQKQKTMELLRRRRAGEKISKLTSSESSSDNDDKRGIYDTDSEDGFEALKEFDDDEEDEPEEEATTPPRSAKGKTTSQKARKKPTGSGDDESEGDLDDFVTDDDDGPIGAPAHLDIPLEFTAQAHKPLKEQFPHVIEWLVHNKINPAFERKDAVYSNAWRKLDDEVHGLASSKFTSAAWKAEFYRALKGRPKLEAYEMSSGDRSRALETCEACGRSGHPATWKIEFQGSPYYKDTLAEVESESDSDSDGDSDNDSVDTQGMTLLPTSKEWFVGVVCCSNAETAHSLIHWKHALKEWVEEKLEDEGWMSAQKLKEREKMKAKKRSKLANRIVDDWRERRIVTALYGDFKKNLDEARNKATTGRGLRGKYR